MSIINRLDVEGYGFKTLGQEKSYVDALNSQHEKVSLADLAVNPIDKMKVSVTLCLLHSLLCLQIFKLKIRRIE